MLELLTAFLFKAVKALSSLVIVVIISNSGGRSIRAHGVIFFLIPAGIYESRLFSLLLLPLVVSAALPPGSRLRL